MDSKTFQNGMEDHMDLDSFIVMVYCEVDTIIKEQFPTRSLRHRGPLPRLSDSEVITMEIVGEYLV